MRLRWYNRGGCKGNKPGFDDISTVCFIMYAHTFLLPGTQIYKLCLGAIHAVVQGLVHEADQFFMGLLNGVIRIQDRRIRSANAQKRCVIFIGLQVDHHLEFAIKCLEFDHLLTDLTDSLGQGNKLVFLLPVLFFKLGDMGDLAL